MVKTLILTITLLAIASVIGNAQGKKSVVIGTMIDKPNAILVINPPNSDQGFLLPQLTSGQRLSIAPSSPQDDGLMVFDLTEKSFYYWSANTWVKGLGDNVNRVLSYDAATQKLTLSGGGGDVDLNTLKEIPSTTGNSGKFLTTDGTTLSWANIAALGDITSIITGQGLSGGAASGDINLSVNTDGTTISVNGSNQLQLTNGAVTTPKIAANALNSSHIIDGSITGADILDNTISTNDLANTSVTGAKIGSGAVNTTHISTGGNDKVLTTNGTGVVTWQDRSSFTDDQGLTLAGNILNIDNGTGADLNALAASGEVAGPLNTLVIQPDAVNSAKILDGAVTTTDIGSGGNDKVLTTNGTGTVTWSDRSTFTDDNQNLGFSGNTLSIDNGTGVNLSVAGQVTGLLDNLVIQPGTSNQVLTTNAAGTASGWVTPGGDVTGALNTTTVGKLQGRDVSNAAPNNGDALIWNGTAWVPTVVTVAATTQYYALDPAAFQPLEPAAGTTTILGLFTAGGAPYVFAKGAARQIMAAVNLPHGATVQSITVFYEYTLLLGPITVNFDRKPFAGGGNQVLSNVATPLLGLGIQSTPMSAITAPDDVIDNSTYSYRVHVTFSNLLNTNDANAIQRIHGIRIEYTK